MSKVKLICEDELCEKSVLTCFNRSNKSLWHRDIVDMLTDDPNTDDNEMIVRTIYILERQGVIEKKHNGLCLTEKGREAIEVFEIQ